MIGRRSFMGAAAAFGTCAWGADDLVLRTAGRAFLPPARRAPGTYSVVVLGDTHYDAPDAATYHGAYPGSGVSAALEEVQRAEFARNGEMWSTRCPRLLAAACAACRPDTAFALQVGDLIQGDCNDATVHAQMAEDAFSAMKNGLGGTLPLYVVVGNHDIRNGNVDDMAGAYRTWLTGKMTAESGETVSASNYVLVKGPDLWIFVDFTAPDLSLIENALKAHAGARYKFLVTHGPVIPSDCNHYNWILYGYSAHENRRRLRSLLMRHDVIVIAGHIHTTELAEIVTDEGRLTQMIANSVWKEETLACIAPEAVEPSAYGTGQTTEAGRSYLGEYHPALVRYVRSTMAGYMRLEIDACGVVARVYGGANRTPSAIWKLR